MGTKCSPAVTNCGKVCYTPGRPDSPPNPIPASSPSLPRQPPTRPLVKRLLQAYYKLGTGLVHGLYLVYTWFIHGYSKVVHAYLSASPMLFQPQIMGH
jgi:hypothetical protein